MNVGIINISGGEFTPHIDCRADIEKYSSGCRHLENILPTIYGVVERRPGTVFITREVDTDVVLPSILSFENTGVCYENTVALTASNDLIPVFICYENGMVCYDNEVIYETQTAILSEDIVCHENSTVFYENEIVTY